MSLMISEAARLFLSITYFHFFTKFLYYFFPVQMNSADCKLYGQQFFNQAAAKYFSEIISVLSKDQRKVISDHGFGSLLLYEKCVIPSKFSSWLAQHVDTQTSEIIVNGKHIPFSKISVHKVLGTPIDGFSVHVDCESGKAFVLSKFNLSKFPCVSFFW